MSVEAPVKKLTVKDYKSDLHNDWCPGCLVPTTRIVVEGGATKPISEIEVGERVLGHDGKLHRVSEVMSHWHPAPMHQVTVKCFGTVTLTPDHPMYVARRERRKRVNKEFHPDWVRADEVKVGDYVAYPRTTESTLVDALPLVFEKKAKDTRSRQLPAASPVNADFLRFAGLYIAEGHAHRRSVVFTFGGHEPHLARETVALAG